MLLRCVALNWFKKEKNYEKHGHLSAWEDIRDDTLDAGADQRKQNIAVQYARRLFLILIFYATKAATTKIIISPL